MFHWERGDSVIMSIKQTSKSFKEQYNCIPLKV